MQQTLYDKNIEALRPRYPGVIEYLELPDNEKGSIPEDMSISADVQDVCGKKVLCVLKDGKTIQMDSLYDSSSLLDVWFETLGEEWDLSTKTIMYGMGSGIYVRKYLKAARNDCSIVVHEPSETIFRTVLENFDLSDLFADTRVRLVFWPMYYGKEDFRSFYHREVLEYKDMGSMKVTFYLNYPRLFDRDSIDFSNGIKDAIDYVLADQVVSERFGEDYNRNTFNNITLLTESYSYKDLVEAMPEDIPAIVVAAGPSLDKNIHELKKAKGKCVIISTDTALKPLALAGIEPDIADIMDGKKDARYLSEESSRRVPLLCTLRSGDTFINLHEGMKFFTDYYCDHIKDFMDREKIPFPHLPTGGSVANSCFGIAEAFHCKTIILVGQDLAYTGDKTHSAVTVRGAKHTAVEDLEHPVMGVDINGDPIRTSLEFKVYKEWFEHEILTHPELKVIDATEGGIKIEGTELMTLKDAIERECNVSFDFKEVLAKAGPLIPDDKKQKYIDYISKIPGHLTELRRMIKVSLSDYISMRKLVVSDMYNTPQFKSTYKKTKDMGKKIEESPIIEYVNYQLRERSSELLDSVNKLEKDEKSDLIAACDLSEKYLNDMLEAISELEPYVASMKSE